MPARQFADDRFEVTTFNTDLGWMAIASAEKVLARLSFGYATRQVAAAGFGACRGASRFYGAPRADDAWPELVERLTAYAAGDAEDFADVEVDLAHLTPLQRRVIDACRRIPFGQTLTYGRLAERAGTPGAARAVGNVMAANRCPLIIPCHRVVPAGGQIGHYSASAGRRTKLRLLEQEGACQTSHLRMPTAVR